MKRTLGVLAGLGLLLRPTSALGQTPTAKLSTAHEVKCTFAVAAHGDWKDGTATVETGPGKLTIAFNEIEADEGTAVAVGTFGPADIIVRLSNGTLHFVQAFREGPLYSTTIFPFELRPNVLRAVHTRHEFTVVHIPGYTSRPEQYYGECEIVK